MIRKISTILCAAAVLAAVGGCVTDTDAGKGVAHQPGRGLQHAPELLVGDLLEPEPRREQRLPERLSLPDVADAGDEPLVEQGVADLPCLVGAAQVGEHRLEVGRRGQDVRPEPPNRPRMQLEHGAVPLASLHP